METDPSTRPSPAEREALNRIDRRDGLILFRNQSLRMDRQLDACEIFGPVLRGALAVQNARSAFGDAPRTLQRVTLARNGYWVQVPSELASPRPDCSAPIRSR